MAAVQRQASIGLALSDPRERSQVGQADLHRFVLHLEEGRPIEVGMTRSDAVARSFKHSNPVADEMPLARGDVVEPARQCRPQPPHIPWPITSISSTSN